MSVLDSRYPRLCWAPTKSQIFSRRTSIRTIRGCRTFRARTRSIGPGSRHPRTSGLREQKRVYGQAPGARIRIRDEIAWHVDRVQDASAVDQGAIECAFVPRDAFKLVGVLVNESRRRDATGLCFGVDGLDVPLAVFVGDGLDS